MTMYLAWRIVTNLFCNLRVSGRHTDLVSPLDPHEQDALFIGVEVGSCTSEASIFDFNVLHVRFNVFPKSLGCHRVTAVGFLKHQTPHGCGPGVIGDVRRASRKFHLANTITQCLLVIFGWSGNNLFWWLSLLCALETAFRAPPGIVVQLRAAPEKVFSIHNRDQEQGKGSWMILVCSDLA